MLTSFLLDTDTAKNILACCMAFPGFLCLAAPRLILNFSVSESNKDQINDLSILLFRCFGSQAMLVGSVLYSAERLGASGFQAFAAAMLPYLAFNSAGLLGKAGMEVKTLPNLCDMFNNILMLAVSMTGLALSATDDEKRSLE
ncbi:hypothetical protein MPSEU_001041000 [Mayamaea pseudoterrestris]|nr:hypothetical protein MPSEU_001041000 [Mayamaea pseudoterrestris]